MRAACVSSVLCMRVIACKAQGSERGACEDEAKPGARHAELLSVQLFSVRHKTRCVHIVLRRGTAAVRCATPPSPPPLHEQPEDSERSSYSERDTTHTHPSCQATHESTRSVLKKTRKDVAVLKQQQEVYYKLKKPPHSR